MLNRASEDATHNLPSLSMIFGVQKMLITRLQESKRTANKIEASCDQRLHTFSTVGHSGQIQSSFYSRLD